MTETPKRPLVTSTALIAAAIAFTLPFIADRIILSAMTDAKDVGIGTVIGMAAYTAAPFLLLDSAMRPRRRVRLALWMGLSLTGIVWIAFARTGYAFQTFTNESNSFFQDCQDTAKAMFAAIHSGSEGQRDELAEPLKNCNAAYDKSGSAHVGAYMLTMLWPALIIGIMGAFAKFGEPNIGEPGHDA